MASTIDYLVGRVSRNVGPLPDFYQIVEWLNAGYIELGQMREWSFRRRKGQMLFWAPYTTGTVSIARGATRAEFVGATLTQAMTGRQLRAGGNNYPIVTIAYVDPLHADLDQPWGSAALVDAQFEIYQAFVTMPADFAGFVVVVDPARSFQLDWWSISQGDIDDVDSQRSYGGDVATHMAFRDYSSGSAGPVGAVVQVRGSGASPVSGGLYSGVEDALFTVEMTSAAQFKWKKDGGAYTTGVALDAVGDAQGLSDGVTVAFSPDLVYSSGDIFVFTAGAAAAPGRLRYEAWPHKKVDESLPYLYTVNLPEMLRDGQPVENWTPPAQIRVDFLVEHALAECAMWKHEDNKYFDLKLAKIHADKAYGIFLSMEKADQMIEATDVMYDKWVNLPLLNVPPSYWVNHDSGPD